MVKKRSCSDPGNRLNLDLSLYTIRRIPNRRIIRGMNDALPGVKRGDGKAVALFVRNAREYGELLLTHIDKEDDVLYPMAYALLSEDKDRELTKDFERVEEGRVGHGKHEEFHRMMDRLKAVYRI